MESHAEKKGDAVSSCERSSEQLNKEKSRHGAGTPKRQAENDTQRLEFIPQINDSTPGWPPQGFFANILPRGAENGRTAEFLQQVIGASDKRIVRELISKERAAGAVILSGPTGYYLPDVGEKGRQEAAAFVAAIKAKGVNTLRAARSAEAFLDMLPGQLEMGSGAGD